MQSLSSPVGVVNERFTCCKYLSLKGVHIADLPDYCQRFVASQGGVGIDLDVYCRNTPSWTWPWSFDAEKRASRNSAAKVQSGKFILWCINLVDLTVSTRLLPRGQGTHWWSQENAEPCNSTSNNHLSAWIKITIVSFRTRFLCVSLSQEVRVPFGVVAPSGAISTPREHAFLALPEDERVSNVEHVVQHAPQLEPTEIDPLASSAPPSPFAPPSPSPSASTVSDTLPRTTESLMQLEAVIAKNAPTVQTLSSDESHLADMQSQSTRQGERISLSVLLLIVGAASISSFAVCFGCYHLRKAKARQHIRPRAKVVMLQQRIAFRKQMTLTVRKLRS